MGSIFRGLLTTLIFPRGKKGRVIRADLLLAWVVLGLGLGLGSCSSVSAGREWVSAQNLGISKFVVFWGPGACPGMAGPPAE